MQRCPRCRAPLTVDVSFLEDQRRHGVRNPRVSYVCTSGHTVDAFVPTTSSKIEPDAGLPTCERCGYPFVRKTIERLCSTCHNTPRCYACGAHMPDHRPWCHRVKVPDGRRRQPDKTLSAARDPVAPSPAK